MTILGVVDVDADSAERRRLADESHLHMFQGERDLTRRKKTGFWVPGREEGREGGEELDPSD